jgi:hypothetical protein
MRVVGDGGESVGRGGRAVRSPLVGGGVERAAYRTVRSMELQKGERDTKHERARQGGDALISAARPLARRAHFTTTKTKTATSNRKTTTETTILRGGRKAATDDTSGRARKRRWVFSYFAGCVDVPHSFSFYLSDHWVDR